MKKILLLLTLSLTGVAQNYKKAVEMAQKFVIVDGHVDLPYRLKVRNFRLEKKYTGIPISSKEGEFDYKRAKKGGLDAPFMSIYIPSSLEPAEGKLLADSLINMVNFIVNENKEYFEIVKSPMEIEKVVLRGKVALPMGMENGSPIERLEDLKYFRKKGISYITLTHAKANRICDSSYDTTKTWKGLSPYGKLVVPAMAREGIMIDVSHVSDDAFYQTIAISPVPVLASHSSVRAFTPGFERNMSDDMIQKMGMNGGVIMVNFGSTFLDGKVSDYRKQFSTKIDSICKARNINPESQEGSKIKDDFFDNLPAAFSNVKMVANHIDRIVKLAGIDHVGLGSDFDGVGNMLPKGLKDVSDYPKLIEELLDRNYSTTEIIKICSGNIFRVWNKTLDYAVRVQVGGK